MSRLHSSYASLSKFARSSFKYLRFYAGSTLFKVIFSRIIYLEFKTVGDVRCTFICSGEINYSWILLWCLNFWRKPSILVHAKYSQLLSFIVVKDYGMFSLICTKMVKARYCTLLFACCSVFATVVIKGTFLSGLWPLGGR